MSKKLELGYTKSLLTNPIRMSLFNITTLSRWNAKLYKYSFRRQKDLEITLALPLKRNNIWNILALKYTIQNTTPISLIKKIFSQEKKDRILQRNCNLPAI